jgi:hypothetical protein
MKNHQQYRDSYMDTTEWLSATVDKMNVCSDVRGDRTAIEAQLQKVLVGLTYYIIDSKDIQVASTL